VSFLTEGAAGLRAPLPARQARSCGRFYLSRVHERGTNDASSHNRRALGSQRSRAGHKWPPSHQSWWEDLVGAVTLNHTHHTLMWTCTAHRVPMHADCMQN
jgi:hypothetical protein